MDPRAKSSPSEPTLLRRWRFQTAVQAARMLNAAAPRDRGPQAGAPYLAQRSGSG